MATQADYLNQALANNALELARMEATRPDYSLDGESYQWHQRYKGLIEARKELEMALQRLDGPWELRSRGVT